MAYQGLTKSTGLEVIDVPAGALFHQGREGIQQLIVSC
jgi:hypothetical protein